MPLQPYFGGADACLVKFSADGTPQSVNIWGSSMNDIPYDVCVDRKGNVWVAGRTEGSFDGEANAGYPDAFLTKFSPDGSRLLTRFMGGFYEDGAFGVCADPAGCIYVAGYEGNTNGGRNATLTKFAPIFDSSSDTLNAAPTVMGGAGSERANTTDATAEPGEPAHGGAGGPYHSVWWKVEAGIDGMLQLNTRGSDFDTVLAVYTNSVQANLITAYGTARKAAVQANNLVCIGSNDNGDGNATSSALAIPVLPGQTYYIAIDGSAASDVGTAALAWEYTGWTLSVDSENPGANVAIEVQPDTAQTNVALTPFTHTYFGGTVVRLSAPTEEGGVPFSHWFADGSLAGTNATLELCITSNCSVKAVYGAAPQCSLGVQSASPDHGVSIVALSNDVHGLTGGETPLMLSYCSNASVQLIAPASASGNQFARWDVDGSNAGSSATLTLCVQGDLVANAVYTPDATRVHTLNVLSLNPAGGVDIGVAPEDVSNAGDDVTPFTRSFPNATDVILSAPASAGCNTFSHWERDGAIYTSENAVALTVTTGATLRAVYTLMPYRSLTVLAENPVMGVPITISLADTNGNSSGATPCVRTFVMNQTVSLTAPDRAGGNTFFQWEVDGNAYGGSSTITLPMNASHTARAVYGRTLQREWTVIAGSSTDDFGSAIASDNAGNIYVAGASAGAFGGTTLLGGDDAVIAKYGSGGNRIWAQLIGSASNDAAAGVLCDGVGNIYVAGTTEGDFNGQANAGGLDAFLAKYDDAGQHLWTRIFGTSEDDSAAGVCADPDGNVYVAGTTYGTFGGDADLFVVKYTPDGSNVWTRIWGSADADNAVGIAAGSNGIFVAGHTLGMIDGQTNAGNGDVCLTLLNMAGTLQWTRLWGSPECEMPSSVAVDNQGCALVVATTFATQQPNGVDTGSSDCQMIKVNGAGDTVWVRQWGSPRGDTSAGVCVGGNNDVYACGSAGAVMDGEVYAGFEDVFVTRFSAAGERQLSRLWGSDQTENGAGITVDSLGNVYVVGATAGSFHKGSNAGGFDICLSKYSEVPEPAVCGVALLAGLLLNLTIRRRK